MAPCSHVKNPMISTSDTERCADRRDLDVGSAMRSFRNRVSPLFPPHPLSQPIQTELRRSLARSFRAMDFNFRVGFFEPPMISGKGRKCLASEHYRMMLTAPCSLSASRSRTAFLWWIFNSLLNVI